MPILQSKNPNPMERIYPFGHSYIVQCKCTTKSNSYNNQKYIHIDYTSNIVRQR
jgi:hypothetical protein